MAQFYRPALAVCWALVLCAAIAAGNENRSQKRPSQDSRLTNQDKTRAVGLSNVQFTNSLYKVLSDEPGNLFFSPLSIHSILTTVWLGAKGTTALQLKSGLKLPAADQTTKDGYRNFMTLLTTGLRGKPTLNVANKIYLSKGTRIKPDFQNSATTAFQTQIEGIDIRDPVRAAHTINQWVEDNTNHKIKDLVVPGMIGQSAMLLVNAVYFKAQWNSVFSRQNTFPTDFKTSLETRVKTPIMYAKTQFSYQKSEPLNCQLVELNYVGNDISMVVILPNQVDGLAELESKLPTIDLAALIDPKAFKSELTTVGLPKFKFEIPTNLNDALKKLGISAMFGDEADFSGMTQGTNSRVSINNVAHKAFIEVNEEGTEAAGASFGGEPLSAPRPQEYFIADHPFIFIIRHKKSMHILFIGRFTTPPSDASVQPEPIDQRHI